MVFVKSIPLLGGAPNLHGVNFLVKKSQVNVFSVNADARVPFPRAFSKGNSGNSSGVVLSACGILIIGRLRRFTHVREAIIAAASMFMIDLHRPLAVNHFPDNPMRLDRKTKDKSNLISVEINVAKRLFSCESRIPSLYFTFRRIDRSSKPLNTTRPPKQTARNLVVSQELQKNFLCENFRLSHRGLQTGLFGQGWQTLKHLPLRFFNTKHSYGEEVQHG